MLVQDGSINVIGFTLERKMVGIPSMSISFILSKNKKS